MSLSRRDFLAYGAGAGGALIAGQGIDLRPVEAAATVLRIKEAKVVPGVCPYCAVGCAQLIYV
ncbi:MAG: twin-arginine translocation signal domain-containing protein, partial [Candidatus Rokuibacteriota bacterium]